MRIYLSFKEDFSDNKKVVAEIINIYTGGYPSPYPDNYLCEIEDVVIEEPLFEKETPRYEIDIRLQAVRDHKGSITKASHPDKTKDNLYDLYDFEAVSAPRLKSKKDLEDDEKYIKYAKEEKSKNFLKYVDPLVCEYLRKQILGYPSEDLVLVREKIEAETNKIENKVAKK